MSSRMYLPDVGGDTYPWIQACSEAGIDCVVKVIGAGRNYPPHVGKDFAKHDIPGDQTLPIVSHLRANPTIGGVRTREFIHCMSQGATKYISVDTMEDYHSPIISGALELYPGKVFVYATQTQTWYDVLDDGRWVRIRQGNHVQGTPSMCYIPLHTPGKADISSLLSIFGTV